MTLSLRSLLLGLTMLAIVAVTLVEQVLEFRQRVREGQEQTAAHTRLLTSAGAPLLVSSLVVGDLATVEQTLRNINRDFAWREVKLYEPDGRRLIIDATPPFVLESSAPPWFRRLLGPPPGETRIELAAEPVVYAVLAVTPSSRQLENALWQGIGYSVVVTAVLLLVFVALVNVILVRGLRPVQALGTSAARLGAGDLSARMPATRFLETAPTVRAFNAMAENLEQAMAELRTNEAALEQREAERKRAERGRAAQLAVSRVLAEADAPEDGIARLLEAIGASLRWDWGEAWRVDADEGVLRSAVSWPASGGAERTLARGMGLAGRVWATGEPDWIEEVSAESGALPQGTRTVCAFPIRGGHGVLALMVFGSRDVRTADDGLLATMTSMGGQIGQYLERKEGEKALRRTEAQLHGMQKMEAIGQLAGGVAHDFNNLLTVIIGRSALLLAQLPGGDRSRRDITLIHDTAGRAAQLTRQLLAFGRKQVLQPKPLNLNTITEGLTPMLRRLVGENIELATHLSPGIGLVKADPSRVEQVIVNLAVNARDAMPRGGRLTVETADVDVDAAYVRHHPGSRAGAHVRLSVSDTGTGMDRATMARIFEPFFTTKGAGAGTGLGLATVYGIVKQSEGTIWVYSEPGHGTVFKVYLPTSTEAATPDEVEAGTPRRSRGTETILLTEDEDGVRELGRDILRLQGYTVLEAGDPDEAMVVSQQHAGSIDLLLTDVVMPRASGRELAERLRPLRPRMKVLYMSGYTDRAIVHHGVLDPDVAFLEKPFTADALARKVREVLDK